MFKSTKTYNQDIGISCCFRQWRANSHCRYLHGYALGFKFIFSATELDENGWVVDFGGLKDLRKLIQATFDHRLVIAADDPEREIFEHLNHIGVADVLISEEGVGIERFAQFAFNLAKMILKDKGIDRRVRVLSCEVSEHGANSAIYQEK